MSLCSRIITAVTGFRQGRRAAGKLRASEEMFRGLFEDAPVGVVLCDMDGTLVEFNAAYQALTGYSAAELRTMTYWDITPRRYDQEAKDGLRRFSREGRFGPFEKEYVRKDGSAIPVLLNSVEVTRGDGRTYIWSMVQDLTQHVETERLLEERVMERTAELEESETRLRTFSEATFEGIVLTRDGVIQEGNRQFAAMFGYDPEELGGLSATDFVPPDIADMVAEKIGSGYELPYESVGLRKDGTTFPIEVQARMTSRTADPLRVTAVRDLTERKQWDEQLRRTQKLQAIGQLTAGVAHNFNNRLMSILNCFEILRMKASFDPKIAAVGEQSAHRAAEMIEQLMAFSRTSDAVTKKPMQTAPLLREACNIVRGALGPEIKLTELIPDDLPDTLGNANQLEQVFINLLLNARDAVEERRPGQPRIEFHASCVEGPGNAPTAKTGQHLCIRVIDNGIGMDEKTRERAFEPFFSTKDVGSGTGLGLATVYGILEEHGGWITCESQRDIGTTFTVFVPIENAEQIQAASDTQQERPSGQESVLIVEDEADVSFVLTKILSRAGYHVMTADNGRAGGETIAREGERLDLAIVDLHMPEMSGVELLRQVNQSNSGLKLILSTGNGNYDLEGATVDGVLIKPYTSSRALQVIRSVLDE